MTLSLSNEHALLFKKLPRPARKGGSLFQTAGLLKEELLQLRHRGVIEGAEPQIIGYGLLMSCQYLPRLYYFRIARHPSTI